MHILNASMTFHSLASHGVPSLFWAAVSKKHFVPEVFNWQTLNSDSHININIYFSPSCAVIFLHNLFQSKRFKLKSKKKKKNCLMTKSVPPPMLDEGMQLELHGAGRPRWITHPRHIHRPPPTPGESVASSHRDVFISGSPLMTDTFY